MANAFKRTSVSIIALVAASLFQMPAQAKEAEAYAKADTLAGAYLAAGAALQEFDFAAAAHYYHQALIFDPDNTDLKRELLVSLINDGRFDEALPFAEELKDNIDIERVSRLVLAVDAIRKDEFAAAQPLLILSEPNDIERLLTGIASAWALQGQGNTDSAIKKIDDLEGPEWFTLFKTYNAALIADAAGKTQVARERYDEAMNNATGGSASPLTYLRLTEAYAGHLVRAGEVTAAKEILDRGIAIAPNNPVLLDLKETLKADTSVRFIKTPINGFSEILLNIGSAINREGAETFASLYLEMAHASNPTEPQTLFELGAIAERLNLTEKAISLYDDVSEGSPLHRPAALQQGLLLSAVDRNEEAVTTLRDLVAESPDDYSGYMALGGVLAVEKKYEDVIEVYKTALTKIDGNQERYWPLHYRLGIAYERTKQWPLAEASFKKALELSPDEADVLNYLGYSWVDMNINLDEGVEMIKKAVEMRPRDGYIIDSLGWAQYRLGKFDEAVTSLETATDLRPRDPTINDHLGDAYWRAGRKLEAAFQWSQVLEMKGDDVDHDLIKAKLEAANSGKTTPLVAISIVDEKSGADQAGTVEKPAKAGTDGG